MSIKTLFMVATLGILSGIISIIVYHKKPIIQPPIAISYNPYEKGIYASGIIESYQMNGSNVNIYPEVSGRILKILVKNGESVEQGAPLIEIDDSIQKEMLAKDLAQMQYAEDNLLNTRKQLEKIQGSHTLNAKSVSLNDLDNAIYAVKMAEDKLRVAEAQYRSDKALLEKYTIKAPIKGLILRIVPARGDYASPSGSYDVYTQGMLPTIQMGGEQDTLQVRAFVDELLVPNLPKVTKLEASMYIRGLDNKNIPLEFDSIQPYTIPNIELSNQKNERVDVRVLPIIFKFKKPQDINLFPGQLVDVFIKGKP